MNINEWYFGYLFRKIDFEKLLGYAQVANQGCKNYVMNAKYSYETNEMLLPDIVIATMSVS